MIFINPHKCCTFVTEKSCLTSNANLCIIQKLKLLPSHYLYWGETLVNRSFLAIRHILAEFKGDKTKRIKVEWEKNRGKYWFTKGLRIMNEIRGKNETLHSLYICFTFGLDLNGVWRVLLYIGAENVMFWAVLTAVWGISWASGRVWLLMWVLYRLDMEMGAGGA